MAGVKQEPSPVLDAAAVKAFAHPLRVRLFYLLDADGPATASGLAARVGESSGSTSYHLRQLARHGVIVEVDGRGTAKERWWQTNPAGFTVRGTGLRRDPSTAAAADLLLGEFVRQRLAESQAWLEESLTADPAWVEASRDHRRVMVLTRSELVRLGEEIEEVVDRYRLASTSRDLLGREDAAGEAYARVIMHLELFPVGVGAPAPEDDEEGTR